MTGALTELFSFTAAWCFSLTLHLGGVWHQAVSTLLMDTTTTAAVIFYHQFPHLHFPVTCRYVKIPFYTQVRTSAAICVLPPAANAKQLQRKWRPFVAEYRRQQSRMTTPPQRVTPFPAVTGRRLGEKNKGGYVSATLLATLRCVK